jgi:TPR repeat protein
MKPTLAEINQLAKEHINNKEYKQACAVLFEAFTTWDPTVSDLKSLLTADAFLLDDIAYAAFLKDYAALLENDADPFITGLQHLLGLGLERDTAKAFIYLTEAAQRKDPRAAYLLGYAHYNKDNNRAFEYYTLAAGQGHAAAQYKLGVCYEFGKGVAPNPQRAFEYYTLAANQGHAVAQYSLGACYKFGKGVAPNPQRAFEYYTLAADQGVAIALYSLGVCYERGVPNIIKPDVNKAAELYYSCYKNMAADKQKQIKDFLLNANPYYLLKIIIEEKSSDILEKITHDNKSNAGELLYLVQILLANESCKNKLLAQQELIDQLGAFLYRHASRLQAQNGEESIKIYKLIPENSIFYPAALFAVAEMYDLTEPVDLAELNSTTSQHEKLLEQFKDSDLPAAIIEQYQKTIDQQKSAIEKIEKKIAEEKALAKGQYNYAKVVEIIEKFYPALKQEMADPAVVTRFFVAPVSDQSVKPSALTPMQLKLLADE